MVKELEAFVLYEEAEETGFILPGKDIGLEILNSSLSMPTKRLPSTWSQALYSSALWKNKRQQTQPETTRVQTVCKAKRFYHWDCQSSEQAAQTGCAVSKTGDFQD